MNMVRELWRAFIQQEKAFAELSAALGSSMKIDAVFVACVKKKRAGIHSARDLYVSPWFLKARAYAEATGARSFVLSAEYGLVPWTRKIASYERTLTGAGRLALSRWEKMVIAQVRAAIKPPATILLLAGILYRSGLQRELSGEGYRFVVPMKGMGIGRQLQFLGLASDR